MKLSIEIIGLTARVVKTDGELKYHIREEDAVEIADWCKQSNCGHRTSFDKFTFKTKEELTMFLLRWG